MKSPLHLGTPKKSPSRHVYKSVSPGSPMASPMSLTKHSYKSGAISFDSLLMNSEPLSAFSTDPLIHENTLLVKKLTAYKLFVTSVSKYFNRDLNDLIVRYLNEDLELGALEKSLATYHAKQREEKVDSIMKKTENRLRRRVAALESDLLNMRERNRLLKERLAAYGEILPPSPVENRERVLQQSVWDASSGSGSPDASSLKYHPLSRHSPMPLSSTGLDSTIDIMNVTPEQQRIRKLEKSIIEYEMIHAGLKKELDALRKENTSLREIAAQNDSRMLRAKQKFKEVMDKWREERHARHKDKKNFEQQIKELKSTMPAMHNEHEELGISTSLDFEYNALAKIAAKPLPIDQHNHFMKVNTDFPTLNTGRSEMSGDGTGRRSLSPYSKSPSTARKSLRISPSRKHSMSDTSNQLDSPVEKMKRMIDEDNKTPAKSPLSPSSMTQMDMDKLHLYTALSASGSLKAPSVASLSPLSPTSRLQSSTSQQLQSILRNNSNGGQSAGMPARSPTKLLSNPQHVSRPGTQNPPASLSPIQSRSRTLRARSEPKKNPATRPSLSPVKRLEMLVPHNGFLGTHARQRKTQYFIHSIANSDTDDLLLHRRAVASSQGRVLHSKSPMKRR